MTQLSVEYESRTTIPKRPPQERVVLAALIGAIIALFWVKVPGAVFHYYSPLPAPWNAIVWITCPPFRAVQNPAWLLSVLNGVLYAAIALSVQFFRKFLHPFAR